jgi:hypothetical protein
VAYLKNGSFLKEIDFTPQELRFLLQLSGTLKSVKYAGTETHHLAGKNIAQLLLRVDLARPGQMIEDQLKAVAVRVAGGVRDTARLRGFPWPGHAGPSRWARASYGGRLADLFRLPAPPGCCRAARGPLAGHGDHGAERGVEHPFAPVDFLAQVQDQRCELGGIARPDPGAERGQAAHERAAPARRRPRGHLGDTQALKREQASVWAGRPGGMSGVVRG